MIRKIHDATWVTRKLGSAYDPETVCDYTGLALWKFPTPCHTLHNWPDPWAMGYWRADGHLRCVRQVTPEEKAWILSNPAQYAAELAQLHAWLASFPTRKQQ